MQFHDQVQIQHDITNMFIVRKSTASNASGQLKDQCIDCAMHHNWGMKSMNILQDRSRSMLVLGLITSSQIYCVVEHWLVGSGSGGL
jgi:hypothetical protein